MARRSHASAVRQRRHRNLAEDRIREAARDASSTAELIDALRAPLNDALGLSGMLLSATDPDTAALATATVVEHLPHSMAASWMKNEYFYDDVNKFRELHRRDAAATTLHRATGGRPELSRRHAHLHRPHGIGPELRATFSRGQDCWGVANLVRESTDDDFGDDELTWLEEVRPVIAAGLQRTTTMATVATVDHAPGVVTLDATGAVLAMTGGARQLLADLWLCPLGADQDELPGEAFMVATMAAARAGDDRAPRPVTRLRGRSGGWLTIEGDSMLTAEGELSSIVLVIQPSRPFEVLPVVVAAYGLSSREREVLDELLRAVTTAEIAARLFISEHTVRDHIRSILTKTGTRTRGELMSALFHQRALASPEPG